MRSRLSVRLAGEQSEEFVRRRALFHSHRSFRRLRSAARDRDSVDYDGATNVREMDMKKNRVCLVAALGIAVAACVWVAHAQNSAGRSAGWQAKLSEMVPLLGHRNWILIVDSAYPLQDSPGIETIETGASEMEVLREVLGSVDHSIHVRPVVFMDAELPFVPEQDAPGVSRARSELASILGRRAVTHLPHEQLLQKVDDVSRSYKVLILKTNETVPYTSVFLQLNCRYWSDDAEGRLRAAMQQAADKSR